MAAVCGQFWDEARGQWTYTSCFAYDGKANRAAIRQELREQFPNRQTRLILNDDDGHEGAVVECDCRGDDCECKGKGKGIQKARTPGNLEALVGSLATFLEDVGAGRRDKPTDAQYDGEPGDNFLNDRTPQEDEEMARERYRRGLAAALFRQRALGDGSMSARLAERQLSAALQQLPPRRKGMVARLMPGGDLSGC